MMGRLLVSGVLSERTPSLANNTGAKGPTMPGKKDPANNATLTRKGHQKPVTSGGPYKTFG